MSMRGTLPVAATLLSRARQPPWKAARSNRPSGSAGAPREGRKTAAAAPMVAARKIRLFTPAIIPHRRSCRACPPGADHAKEEAAQRLAGLFAHRAARPDQPLEPARSASTGKERPLAFGFRTDSRRYPAGWRGEPLACDAVAREAPEPRKTSRPRAIAGRRSDAPARGQPAGPAALLHGHADRSGLFLRACSGCQAWRGMAREPAQAVPRVAAQRAFLGRAWP